MNQQHYTWQVRVFKRIFDLLFGSLIFITIFPLFLLISILVKLSGEGPIFFRQTRQGLDGKLFYIYKFRTMGIYSDSEGIVKQAMRTDPRVTRIGRFLRKTSLDELPQFLNVLRGDMSLVGPRAMIPAHNEFYYSRFSMHPVTSFKPGITGWSQIYFFGSDISTEEIMKKVLEYDNYYCENWSVYFDLKIILLTIVNSFRAKRAY